MTGCWERIAEISRRNKSHLCVGLDTDLSKIPQIIRDKSEPIFNFNRAVIDATLDLVCCYKPNAAFYESHGIEGMQALVKTIEYIDRRVPVILDFKRGDIGNTAANYAKAAFQWLKADAITVNPYMGLDSVSPFLEYQDKGVFILCLTSNPGSEDFQFHGEDKPLYETVARKVLDWDSGKGQLGLVVGATHPGRISSLRKVSGNLPFLLPGIGTQGGSLQAVSAAQVPGDGLGVVVNASRSIIYAGSGNSENIFTNSIRKAAMELKELIESSLSAG